MAEQRTPSESVPRNQPEQTTGRQGLSVGTVVLALVLAAAVAAGGAVSALMNYDLVGLGHLPRCAVFAVFILLWVNAIWVKVFGRRPLSTAQLSFVYIAILVMAGFPGQQLVTYIYIAMIGGQYLAAGQGNEYATELVPYIKRWMVPSMDPEGPVIAWAFHGLPWGERIPWGPWVAPILAWTPYLLALLGLQLSLAALLRERWDQERLTYPLAQVPVELATYKSPRDALPELLNSKLFWAMFLIPTIIYSRNALSLERPDVQPLNLYKNLGLIFGTPPWTNLDYLPLNIYFETMGATYLVPAAVGFSLWFFWLFRRFIYIYRDTRGLMDHEAYLTQQGIGAYLFLAGLCLWGARTSLARSLRATFSRRRSEDERDEGEPMSPSLAVVGVLLSVAVILFWGQAAGASPAPILVMLVIYAAGLIVLSRLVAESGLFCVWVPMSPHHEVVARAWGTFRALEPQVVTAVSYMGMKIQDTASQTMANIMQGFKVGELARLKAKPVVWLMIGSMVVAMLASHPPSIWAIYTQGIYDLGWWPRGSADIVPSAVHNLTTALSPYKAEAYTAMAHGVLIVAVLHLVKTQFHKFPLLAFAYAATLGPQWMMDRYGFSIFIGWVVKSLVLRYGGIGSHSKLRPAAFGLICGNACVLLFWTIYHYFSPVEGVLVTE